MPIHQRSLVLMLLTTLVLELLTQDSRQLSKQWWNQLQRHQITRRWLSSQWLNSKRLLTRSIMSIMSTRSTITIITSTTITITQRTESQPRTRLLWLSQKMQLLLNLTLSFMLDSNQRMFPMHLLNQQKTRHRRLQSQLKIKPKHLLNQWRMWQHWQSQRSIRLL